MHDQVYFVVLLVLSHLHEANPTFGIWQYQNTNDLFQVNAKKLVFPLGLLMRLSVEFGNLNTALGRKKTKEIYQWK